MQQARRTRNGFDVHVFPSAFYCLSPALNVRSRPCLGARLLAAVVQVG